MRDNVVAESAEVSTEGAMGWGLVWEWACHFTSILG